MAVLAILEADARVATRLSSALASDHRVVLSQDWDSFLAALDREAFDGCLIDVDHPDRATVAQRIARLQEAHPRLAVIACVEGGDDLGYYDLGGLGVAGIVLRGPQPQSRVRAGVERALATARADRIVGSLEGKLAPPGPRAIGWAVEHAGAGTSVRRFAAALGYTPRSLRHALDEAGLPAPTRVLLWGRLLLAGARLGCDGRTVEEVAFSLGYSTAGSLARAMKGQTGLTPGEVSEAGGMERVRDALFSGSGHRLRGNLEKIASLLVLVATLAGCASPRGGGATHERDAIDQVLARPPLERAHVGILAVDARTGDVLYAHDADRWFVPASNQKILVTSAAWSLLGPDYRYRTELWAEGPLVGERLEGDLLVIASGDPSLSGRYWNSGVAALEALADSVHGRGVRRVSGRVVVDVSAWDSTTVFPTREVHDLPFGFGATGGAFAIDEGELRVVVRGGERPGVPALVSWSPGGEDGFVTSMIRTAASGDTMAVAAHYLPESRRVILEGRVPVNSVDTLAFAQRDPVRLAVFELGAALERRGVRVDGGTAVIWDEEEPPQGRCAEPRPVTCSAGRLLAVLESPPLSELAAAVLGDSQNWMAEQLVLTLGSELGAQGSLDEGLRQIGTFLVGPVGIDSLDVRSRDGSGISAYNLVTPRSLVRALRHMDARPDGVGFRRALAEPGEEGSTLEDRLGDLEGRVFAKTGSISNVDALSGHVIRKDGARVVFSILVNASGGSSRDVREAIDDVVRLLAR